MSEIEFIAWVEIPIRVFAEFPPEERDGLRLYPGCQKSIEINEIKIETKLGKRILTLDEFKNYILAEEDGNFIFQAWEHIDDV